MANISETIREARLRWLGHVEGQTEDDVVMRTWNEWTLKDRKAKNEVERCMKGHEGDSNRVASIDNSHGLWSLVSILLVGKLFCSFFKPLFHCMFAKISVKNMKKKTE